MEQSLQVVSPITVRESEQYSVIITDAEDTTHFFLKKDGSLFYDGYSRPGSTDREKEDAAEETAEDPTSTEVDTPSEDEESKAEEPDRQVGRRDRPSSGPQRSR